MKRLVSLVALSMMVACICSCHRETEQDKVKNIITDIQRAAEAKDIAKIVIRLSKTYNDPQGNTYDDIKGLVIGYFYQYGKISIYIPSIHVSVQNAVSTAVFQVILTSKGSAGSGSSGAISTSGTPNDNEVGKSAGKTTPLVITESLGMYAFDVSLIKEEAEWKVTSARWVRLGEAVK
jgi:hypothetical protein